MELSQPPSVVERVRHGRHNLHIVMSTHRRITQTLDLGIIIIVGIRVTGIKGHGATRQAEIKNMNDVISADCQSVAIVVSKSYWNKKQTNEF